MSFTEFAQPWLGLIGGLIAVGVAIATYFRGQRAIYERLEAQRLLQVSGVVEQREREDKIKKDWEAQRVLLEDKIHKLDLDLTSTTTRFSVFWTIIEKELPKILIKPHRLDIDMYLIKMKDGYELSHEEKIDMKNKMREALDEGISNIDSGLALGYALLVARIESEEAVDKSKKEKEKNI